MSRIRSDFCKIKLPEVEELSLYISFVWLDVNLSEQISVSFIMIYCRELRNNFNQQVKAVCQMLLIFSLFQQQCNSSLIFPDSLASVPSQFGLSIPDLEHGQEGQGGHLGHQPHHGHHHSGHQGLTLMGVSSALQPVLLPSDQHSADIGGHQGSGDKSPLPELTQLSSHDFTRGNSSDTL